MHLTLQNVTKVVNGQTHLYGIDLELASGSFNVLLGPTRAGKTSMMRLMAGSTTRVPAKSSWTART
jgi:glycerol transport system ATP-binding protein